MGGNASWLSSGEKDAETEGQEQLKSLLLVLKDKPVGPPHLDKWKMAKEVISKRRKLF